MGPAWANVSGFMSAHWEAIVAGALCYLLGIRFPVYCARCRQFMRLEEEIRSRLHRETRERKRGGG